MGDIAGNAGKIRDALAATAAGKPDLLVFPELFLNGYPPRDLLEHAWFLTRGLDALEDLRALSARYPETGILIGIAYPETASRGKGVRNAAVLLAGGSIVFRQDKSLLPTYDVFDESRYFDPASETHVCRFKDETLGITICEDAWNVAGMWDRPLYARDPVREAGDRGATVHINLSASPFHLGKQRLRFATIRDHAARLRRPFVFVNLTGGNDELIFDGGSMYFNARGEPCEVLPRFAEEIRIIDTAAEAGPVPVPAFDTIDSVHDALVLGLADYLSKCGIGSAIVGLSGGIDSAVTAALAVSALGPRNVVGVTMPSRYSSGGSVADARALARNLGIRLENIPIEPLFSAFLTELAGPFQGTGPDSTEENIQARIRGGILMALSNKFHGLVLATGNKSELAVGYCTLYGDMNGGLSVISDLPKTRVYELARHINATAEVIPESTLTKPPSAELRENQKDQDSLPPYDVLDRILSLFIEDGASCDDAVEKGFDRTTVEWVSRAIARNEYKRRQAAPGLRVTPKAFGMGRRFPIAARYAR
ncbi:MAG: NAD+ synthase [Chitinivibrionales bacterium]|nr:NAD+ synthase [Chitinivibrionales bacterium]MBD3397298.1 NAD+ synthase [Chitinivibrionales bacterium]